MPKKKKYIKLTGANRFFYVTHKELKALDKKTRIRMVKALSR